MPLKCGKIIEGFKAATLQKCMLPKKGENRTIVEQ